MNQTNHGSASLAPVNLEFERHLRQYAASHAHALLEHWEFEGAEDSAEAIHQLRVATRRLRALVEVLGEWAPGHEPTRRQLRRVTRKAGPLREADVNAENLLRLQRSPSSLVEAAALEYISLQISSQRHVERRVTRQVLKKISTEKLVKSLAALLEDLVERLAVSDLAAVGWQVLKAKLGQLAESLEVARASRSGEDLHEVRICIKRLRYAVELLKPLFKQNFKKIHGELKQLQEHLGTHHDLYVLYGLIRGERDRLREQGHRVLVMGMAGPLHHLAAAQRELTDAFFEDSERFNPRAFAALVEEGLCFDEGPTP